MHEYGIFLHSYGASFVESLMDAQNAGKKFQISCPSLPSRTINNDHLAKDFKKEQQHDDDDDDVTALSYENRLWTLEEDIILCELQSRIGNDWAVIAKELHNRSRVEAKIRHRSITRAAKKHWTEEQNILLLKAYAGFNYSWNESLLSMFPTRTRNCLKLRIQELLKSDSSVKNEEFIPAGSPKQILIHRPDLVQSFFTVTTTVSADVNSSTKSVDENHDKTTTPQTASRTCSHLTHSQSLPSIPDILALHGKESMVASPKSERNKRVKTQNIDSLVCESQNDSENKRRRRLTKRQRTMIALMNQTGSQQSKLPFHQQNQIKNDQTSNTWIMPKSETEKEKTRPAIDDSFVFEESDIESLIKILS